MKPQRAVINAAYLIMGASAFHFILSIDWMLSFYLVALAAVGGYYLGVRSRGNRNE